MAKSKDLKVFLESSLNEIFKATVSDILESVDQTLSEYKGKIQRIETENEDLKRRLHAQDHEDVLTRGTYSMNIYEILTGECIYIYINRESTFAMMHTWLPLFSRS